MSTITGVVNWAHVQAPNQFGKYSVDVEISAEQAEKYKAGGISGVKEKDGQNIIQIRTNATMKDGSPARKPSVTDVDGNEISDLVGNGSKAKVSFTVAPWKFGSRSGKSAFLNGLTVIDLVPYGDDGDEWSDNEGDELY